MNDAPGFGLYVHWPFCLSKCPYCDFNSHVGGEIDGERWRRAMLAELDHMAVETSGRSLNAIFFGGGTPSLMPPAIAAAVIKRATDHWPAAADLEITLEANPTSVEAGRLAAFRAAGVNRVSLGVQALDDRALGFLGRQHSAREARDAVELAARLFDRFSFDLIYARPEQTLAAWEAELEEALAFAGDHLSLYQLIIEPGTRFATQYARGDFTMPDDELGAALYEFTQARLEAAGMPAYEISNHARPGGACRHNLIYWEGGDYVGVGPGAHGRLTVKGKTQATRTHRAPGVWLSQVESRGHAEKPRETVPPRARMEELLMMGLRLTAGVSTRTIAVQTGAPLEEWIEPERLEALEAAGFLTVTPDRVAATFAGRQRLNAVLKRLLG